MDGDLEEDVLTQLVPDAHAPTRAAEAGGAAALHPHDTVAAAASMLDVVIMPLRPPVLPVVGSARADPGPAPPPRAGPLAPG